MTIVDYLSRLSGSALSIVHITQTLSLILEESSTAVCYTTLPYASYNLSFTSDNNTQYPLPACMYVS